MPELPEVETVRRGLAPAMVGARIEAVELRRPGLRFPFPESFAARLAGREVLALGRRAKYLLADLSSGEVLVMHLGMTGRFAVAAGEGIEEPGRFHHEAGRAAAHDHVRFRLSSGAVVTYNDARRFGFMLLVPREALDAHPLFRGLGLEPLGERLDGAALARLFAGRRTPLKSALLDQRLVAGLGNIYASEALHRAGLSPLRAAGTLDAAAAGRLAAAIRAVLDEAVAAGGSTLRDHRRADGQPGAFQQLFRVYDRAGAPCRTPGCAGEVARFTQGGRSTFHCPACQR